MKAIKFALDSALRNMYRALRNKEFRFMAIEFEHRGKKYRADTAKEAAELQFLLASHDAQHGSYEHPRVWTADLAMDLLGGIGDTQRKLLAILSESLDAKRTSRLIEGLGLESEISLAGVVSGLSKQIRKMSLSPRDVYQVEVQWKGRSKERFFRLLPDLREAFEEIGFPEAWEKNQRK